jgi:carbonic anhydrase
MSLLEHVQEQNARYASRFDRSKLALPPARNWAIVACMDARLTVEEVAGIGTGDAHIIRNAGGLATDDAIRSLVISTHLLGTKEFAIIEHTGCGMLTFEEEPVRRQISERTGAKTDGFRLYPFHDLEANLTEQVRRVAASPLLPKGIPVTGFIYEVETGRLRPVTTTKTGEKTTAEG